jgi:hypothetical protein
MFHAPTFDAFTFDAPTFGAPTFDPWLQDIESLEALAQDQQTRAICLRLASMSQAGTLANFVSGLRHDHELDEVTKRTIAEIAGDASFLLAVEDYVRRTCLVH